MSEQVMIRQWGDSQGIRIPKFKHKTFEERLAEYHGEISVGDFDWGDDICWHTPETEAISERMRYGTYCE